MHLIIKNHACYNIMSVIASLIATYKRYALVIHFGATTKLGSNKDTHFPCKEKFEDEPDPNKNQCLRVFPSAARLKQHRTLQENHGNKRHHNPKEKFPNLLSV